MKKYPYALILTLLLFLAQNGFSQAPVIASRLQELFDSTTLIKNLSDPWELIYGPDNYLWVTEARGYRVRRIHPNTGASTIVLNISSLKNFPRYDKINDATDGGKPWPQGGLMGMAIHPEFLTGKPYVYLGYVYNFAGAAAAGKGCAANWGGCFFTSRVVRYSYNFGTNQLTSPVILCDTIPGSSDHNSGRMIIAPYNGSNYLFYSVGDMGGGQFDNGARPINAQNPGYYEGKILRFNLEPDGDGGTYDRWIPNDNPFNAGLVQSAVWSIGHRNVQGLAYAFINGQDMLYATEHGPFTDDELNIVEKGKNYGHPLVIGRNDGNYNNSAAGASGNGAIPGSHNSSAPLITNENTNATAIGAVNYRAPIKTFYSASQSTVNSIFNANVGGNYDNSGWPSEGISSVAVYRFGPIPNWSSSLFITTLKGGKIFRLRLSPDGRSFQSLNGADTVSYFRSANRFRDIEFSPDGLSVFVAIDSSQTTSGPTSTNPMVSVNRGSIMKFTYNSGGILPVRDPVRPEESRPNFNVSAYPNPVSKFLYILFEGAVHKPVSYQLFDVTGKLVQEDQTSENNFMVNVQEFRKGVYVLKVYNGRGAEVKTQKVIVQ